MVAKVVRHLIICSVITLLIVSTQSGVLEAKSISNDYLQQSKQLYNRGEISSAISILERGIERDIKQQDFDSLAIAYNYLALNYLALENWNRVKDIILAGTEVFDKIDNELLEAHFINTKGLVEAKTGRLEAAISSWQTAAETYQKLNEIESLLQAQINQAQAFRSLGYNLKAEKVLERTKSTLEDIEDSLLKAKLLQSLGIELRSIDELAKSQLSLEVSLSIAEKLNLLNINSIRFSLAATLKARKKFEDAEEIYLQIKEQSNERKTKIKANINWIALLIQNRQQDLDKIVIRQTIDDLAKLPNSIEKINLYINLATNLMEGDSKFSRFIPPLLESASTQAKQFNNPRLQSLSQGKLGHYYEKQQQWQLANKTTRKAIILADSHNANFLSIRWYWQQARINLARGDKKRAITNYKQAINNLQSLRQDLAANTLANQFSFRDRVEPLYRQYVELLLQNIDSLPPATQQQYLADSREAIESLQLAELENYFRESCLAVEKKAIEEIDSQAVTIYPILLQNRLEVIVSLPQQPLKHYGTTINIPEQNKIFADFNFGLVSSNPPQTILPPAQQLYDILIRPIQQDLRKSQVETIVFVLDGWLRDLPMSALHDGESYLIEQYNISLTSGLQLIASENATTNNSRILGAGITQAKLGFSALPNVADEIAKINNLTKTKILVDRQFTQSNFADSIETEDFAIVHLATHGQFSSKIEDTFLLAWDRKINIQQLARILQTKESDRHAIELLVLSACETARGDNRASLGMAGIAVRSGARSTIASLWNISDRSTAILMSNFYQSLRENQTKAKALRQAQLSLINSSEYNHPYYWSPFVLIGNWQ